jgi:hypothetical protein
LDELLWSSLSARFDRAAVLSDAAQLFAEEIYANPRTAASLVRIFATVPFAWLPTAETAYVREFLERGGEARELNGKTPVLALLGTRGIEPRWNDRTQSVGHRAIPLVSEAFVAGAPMIARLLRETGFSLPRSMKQNPQFVSGVGEGNLFFVGDASNTTDERGRRIIPATDFVDRYGIRTVYGSGAAYPADGIFLTGIVFSRRVIARDEAATFAPLVRRLVAATSALATRERLYSPPRTES